MSFSNGEEIIQEFKKYFCGGKHLLKKDAGRTRRMFSPSAAHQCEL